MCVAHSSAVLFIPLCSSLAKIQWTREEEEYVAALIEEFKKGHLRLKEGMSLRCFISKMVRW